MKGWQGCRDVRDEGRDVWMGVDGWMGSGRVLDGVGPR
jgi:hypothetical protein